MSDRLAGAPRIAFATDARYPALSEDDRIAAAALAARGAVVEPRIWSDGGVAWEACDAVVLRSTWDYHTRPAEFLAWLDRLEALGVTLWNSYGVARWNSDKHYLRDLAAAGLPVVPTEWVARGTRLDLGALLDRRGWREAVVKPTVSASAFETVRCDRRSADAAAPRLARLLESRDLMVQPFLPEIATAGEWSIMLFGGRFSHAVRKRPAPGDFRVQAEWGGDAVLATPPAALVELAATIAGHAPGEWLYARVDGVETGEGYRLLELEMLEPSLFFAADPAAADRFADVLLGRLDGTRGALAGEVG